MTKNLNDEEILDLLNKTQDITQISWNEILEAFKKISLYKNIAENSILRSKEPTELQ